MVIILISGLNYRINQLMQDIFGLEADKSKLYKQQIIRIFTRIRELLVPNKDILQKLMDLENKGLEHDKKIKLLFEYLDKAF